MEKDEKTGKKNYKSLRKAGSYLPGYSNPKNVKLTRYRHIYHGIALAIKNDYGIRCEVRGIH